MSGNIRTPINIMEVCVMRWETALLAAAVILAGCVTKGELERVPRISKEEVKPLVETGRAVVIDVRSRQDWNKSEYKIKGAVRETSSGVESWMGKYSRDKKTVIYCA